MNRLKDILGYGFQECDEDFPTNIKRKSGSNNKIIKYEIPLEVRVRVYDVNIKDIVLELREGRTKKGFKNKDIAEKLNKPLTLVEHWFRADKYNAIPSDDIWLELKGLLEITTDRFDKVVMTYENRAGKHDQTNRVYDLEGLIPTLMTSTPIRVTDGVKIRELTAEEMWLLMGFSLEDYLKIEGEVSERQIIKQTGNSIVLNVMEEILKGLL